MEQYDLNLGGSRIIHLGEPVEQHHAVTKAFAESLHDPSHNKNYINYVNQRKTTLHSLLGLCKIKTDFTYLKTQHNNPCITWLETCTSPLQFRLVAEADLAGKSIEIKYLFPVIVSQWKLYMVIQSDYDWDITYRWQTSNDGIAWVTQEQDHTAEMKKEEWNGNNRFILLENAENTPYMYWRIAVVEGVVNKIATWIDYLIMTIR